MKKQIHPSIKAHLLWSALILLSLLAVCAIPFALAQRNSTKRSVAKPDVVAAKISGTDQSQIPTFPYSSVRTYGPQTMPAGQSQRPTVSSGPSVPKFSMPPVPKLPAVTLYDQYNNAGANSTVSQDFETANNAFDNQLADDFVVPGGQTWNITEVDVQAVYFNGPGPAASFNVFFYQDSGTLPGTNVYTATGLSYSGNPDFVIPLTAPAVLTPGTYWVSVQARMDFTPFGE